MRLKELSLWLLFLVLCFSAGYFKGQLPSDAGSSFFGTPVEVEILITDEMFLPSDVRIHLQKKLNIQIKTLIVKDREEFNIRTITSPGYHLALIPDHWIEPANLASQMSNLNPLIELMNERVSFDFLKMSRQKMYGVPLYWILTNLYQSSGLKINEPLNNFYFLKDWDEITNKILVLNLDKKNISPIELFSTNQNSKEVSEQKGVYEISHLDKDNSNKLISTDLKYTSLYLWSLCTPRHSPSRKTTLKLIKALTEPDLQLMMIEKMPLATTLKTLDKTAIGRDKKALSIRDLDLSHLKKPQILSLEKLKKVKAGYLVN